MNRDGTCTPRRKLERRKGPPTVGSPFSGGDLSGDRRGASEAQGEHGSRLAAARTEREPHGGSAPPPVVPSPRPEAAATCGAGG